MDINIIAQLIGSVGFPICMSIYLIYFMQTELKEMRKSIENNTLTMQKLLDALDERESKA
mgnify:CR=1 FL=1